MSSPPAPSGFRPTAPKLRAKAYRAPSPALSPQVNTAADAPIFVVGAPRSGTTLLASMLAGHSRIACGPETQFFNKLSPKQLQAALSDRAWPRRAVALLGSLTLAGQPVAQLFGHSEDDVRAFLEARQPSTRALLEALTALYAEKRGKARWAEKTPNHLLHLPTLRQHFPASPVVRILRDPRDSALSMRQLPWASPSALANSYTWAAWFSASQPFFERDPRTLTVRYEDLIAHPEAVLAGLCSFIGERFEPGMLDTVRTGREVSSPHEVWKAANLAALDTSRTQLWRKESDPDLQRALTCACRPGLEAFGYPDLGAPAGTTWVYPLGARTAEVHERFLLQAAAQGVEVRQPDKPAAEPELVLLPGWSGSRRAGFRTLLAVGRLLALRCARGLKTHYTLPEKSPGDLLGRASVLLCRWLAEQVAPPQGRTSAQPPKRYAGAPRLPTVRGGTRRDETLPRWRPRG